MATGLLALLDDVAAIAKLASASLDDVVAQSTKAGVKAAGVVIDDTAVTPRYVVGLKPERELPIVSKIAMGSLRNKLLFLLPLCLLLNYFAPWLVPYLLMVGGAYLAYEGAEKLHGVISPHGAHKHEDAVLGVKTDPVALENEKVKGAILTDFILSAEIMALTLSQVSESSFATQVGVLAIVGIFITVAVYGVVGLIVKADDLGIYLTKTASKPLQVIGRSLVVGMPRFLNVLAAVGTGAMLWVGGSIMVHSAAQIGFEGPEHLIHGIASGVAQAIPVLPHVVEWIVTSAIQAVLAIAAGALLIVVMGNIVAPILGKLRGAKAAGH